MSVEEWMQTEIDLAGRLAVTRNLRFMDPVTGDYFSKGDGTILRPLDAGQIIGSNTSIPQEVIVENKTDFPLTGVRVWLDAEQVGLDVVQISRTEHPFVPEPLPLSFPGTHAPGAECGRFWVRVRTNQRSKGSPSVFIRTAGRPVVT